MKQVSTPTLRDMLAQKIMLDVRYFCQPEELVRFKGKTGCSIVMTELPEAVKSMITSTNLGGIILFSENLAQSEQIVKLTHELQTAAGNSRLALPLLIATDQEGGRVARLPRDSSTALSGNMAIGATYDKYNTEFARLSGQVLGRELNSIGINVNFAPTVDVNINAKNPVINVRSFGEEPRRVAELGTAQLAAMQEAGVIGTLKHFPGHGDTHVDSHTGLPRVDHNMERIEQVDLMPFQFAIDQGHAQMIMTAHIQYPALDDSTFVSKDGKSMLKPATMSERILTGLLREKMGFQGIVITDALDMAGISDFMTETQAVIETFNAGSDIALMPIKIRSIEDMPKFESLLDELELAVQSGHLDRKKVETSFARILKVKSEAGFQKANKLTLTEKMDLAKTNLYSDEHKQIDEALSDASITLLKGDGRLSEHVKTLHVIMPDENKCRALAQSLNKFKPKLRITCGPSYETSFSQQQKFIGAADAVLFGNITPKQSAVEMGGMEDLHKYRSLSRNKWSHDRTLLKLLKFAKEQGRQNIFVSLRTPYEIKTYGKYSNDVLATFSYNSYSTTDESGVKWQVGAAYRSLAKVLAGQMTPIGRSPVTIRFKQ